MWGRTFPTSAGTWPNTAYAIEDQFAKAGVSDSEKQRLLHGNAARW